jgi:hypothetical protein
MSDTNQILLPVLLFVVYFLLAIQFLPQPSTAIVSDRLKVIKEQANPIVEIIQVKGSTNDLEAAVI